MKTKQLKTTNNNKSKVVAAVAAITSAIVIAISMLTLSFCTQASTTEANAYAANSATVQQLIEQTANRQGVPAITVAVVDNGDTRFYIYGETKVNSGIAVDRYTYFGLGSVSKAYTALALLYLDYNSEFDFNLTDSLIKHIPWLSFNYRAEDFCTSEITIKNLIYHTSGITNEAHSLRLPPSFGENASYDVVRLLNGASLQFRPSSRYEYGSSNYIILGLVVQIVTGMSFGEFLTTRILNPLGLYNTKVCASVVSNNGTMASAHMQEWFRTSAFTPPKFDAHIPTGFINSNASDMAMWLNLKLNPQLAIAPFNYLLQAALMPNTAVDAFNGSIFGMRGDFYYSAGWMVTTDGYQVVHLGESPGFLSAAWLMPQRDKAIAILMNSSSGDVANLLYNIVDVLLGYGVGDITSGSEFRLFDTIFAIISIAFGAIALVLIVALIVKLAKILKGKSKLTRPKKGRIALFILAILFTAISVGIMIIFPMLFNVGSWAIVNLWISQAVMVGFIVAIAVGVLSIVLGFVRVVFN